MCLDETDESGSKEETDSHSNTIYHRRFSASFIEISASTFEPLIVCYVTKEKKMQVRTTQVFPLLALEIKLSVCNPLLQSPHIYM